MYMIKYVASSSLYVHNILLSCAVRVFTVYGSLCTKVSYRMKLNEC